MDVNTTCASPAVISGARRASTSDGWGVDEACIRQRKKKINSKSEEARTLPSSMSRSTCTSNRPPRAANESLICANAASSGTS